MAPNSHTVMLFVSYHSRLSKLNHRSKYCTTSLTHGIDIKTNE